MQPFRQKQSFYRIFDPDGHALVSIVVYNPHPLDYCHFMRCVIGRGGMDMSASPLFLNKKDMEIGLCLKK
jgi:hypothetical protein